MGSLTILLMNKLNVQLKLVANKINTATLHPINKYVSNVFTANKCSEIINQMKIFIKYWFKETYSQLILKK